MSNCADHRHVSRAAALAPWAVTVLVGCSPGSAPTNRAADELPGDGEIVRASDFGDRWPFTVAEGRVNCMGPGSNVVFTAPDGRTYAINGTARGSRRWADITPIWKSTGPLTQYTPLERLPESDRQAIFAASVACEYDATDEAISRHPNDVNAQRSYEQRVTASCKANLRRERKLTEAELDTIELEGASVGWPPLSPTRVSIGPIIDRGLQLCSKSRGCADIATNHHRRRPVGPRSGRGSGCDRVDRSVAANGVLHRARGDGGAGLRRVRPLANSPRLAVYPQWSYRFWFMIFH